MTSLSDELVEVIAGQLQRGAQESQEKKICFGLWDFAGQELYYTTHQVMITNEFL